MCKSVCRNFTTRRVAARRDFSETLFNIAVRKPRTSHPFQSAKLNDHQKRCAESGFHKKLFTIPQATFSAVVVMLFSIPAWLSPDSNLVQEGRIPFII
jgi:hypothetical protein